MKDLSIQSLLTLVTTITKKPQEGYDLITNAPGTTPYPTIKEIAGTISPEGEKALAAVFGIVIILFVLFIILWFVALYLLVKHWNRIPTWAKVVGVVCLYPQIPLGPVITIIIVLACKNRKN